MSVVALTPSLAIVTDNGITTYFLHAVSEALDSRYVPDGHSLSAATEEGEPHIVKLFIKIDESVESFDFRTPIYHLISLADLGLVPGGNATIEVQTVENGDVEKKKIVTQDDAEPYERPIPN